MDVMGKKSISIPELLPFEPYIDMHHLIERFFVGDTSPAVTPDDMTRLEIKCHKMLTELKKAFEQDISAFQMECMCIEVESCKALFHILQRRGFKTWKHFERGFSRFSIFCGRNPMVRMRRPAGPVNSYFTSFSFLQDIAGRLSLSHDSSSLPLVSRACSIIVIKVMLPVTFFLYSCRHLMKIRKEQHNWKQRMNVQVVCFNF